MALWCGNNEVSEGWQRWGWLTAVIVSITLYIWLAYNHQRINQQAIGWLVQGWLKLSKTEQTSPAQSQQANADFAQQGITEASANATEAEYSVDQTI